MKKVAVIMGSDSDWPVVKGACQQLAQAEQQVAGHAHTAGKVAVGRAGGGVLGIIGMPDEPADQELRHIYLSSPEVRSKNTT